MMSLNPCFNGRYSQSVKNFDKAAIARCLNPCFNGRYSQRRSKKPNKVENQDGLNPCFNGRYSQSQSVSFKGGRMTVLILVLMEDTLRAVTVSSILSLETVLILVLMEDTLRGFRCRCRIQAGSWS